MKARAVAAGFAALIAVTPALAQQSPAANAQPETNCTPSAAANGKQTTGSTAGAMAQERSAILPSAGGHAQSAAPTVQQNGEPMRARPDCPPDPSKK